MKKILLITISISMLLFADFIKNGDIVTDTVTNLQWQDNADAKNIKKSWLGAINYCENLTLAGHSDWRLPNINELKSIIDRSKRNPSVVNGFTNIDSSDEYWSSTTYEGNSFDAWVVNFYFGFVGSSIKGGNFSVRCVRAGQ